MKPLVLSIALLAGGDSWPEKGIETFAGLTCATRQEADTIAASPIRYNFSATVERTRCTVLAFPGRLVGETGDFNIGNHLFTFRIVEVDGQTLYVLTDKGEGWVT